MGGGVLWNRTGLCRGEFGFHVLVPCTRNVGPLAQLHRHPLGNTSGITMRLWADIRALPSDSPVP